MSKLSTLETFDEIIHEAFSLFEKKTLDYGIAWRILRLPSLTDQIFIKAQRIRSLQEKGEQKVSDSVEDEFIGIINYCIIALIQTKLNQWVKDPTLDDDDDPGYFLSTSKNYNGKLEKALTIDWYKNIATDIRKLLDAKNHDYGEAWRDMRVSSITDLILMKLLRIKQIEDNDGVTKVSEPIESGYQDIVNYSVFSLILLKENDT